MTRYDAVNYISHGIAKRPGLSEAKPARGAEEESERSEPRETRETNGDSARRKKARSTPIASTSTRRRATAVSIR